MKAKVEMKADVVKLQTLFQQQVSYRIPQFQRPYAWEKDRQWEPLWKDVRDVAERCLNRTANDKIRPHFMGAIVLQQRKSGTGEVRKSLVIDGQQRLTTLQLLIKATEQAFQSQDYMVRVERLRELTTNQKSHCGDDNENQTKIRQSNIIDRRAFQEVIIGPYSDEQSQCWTISQAYIYFKTEVRNWLRTDPQKQNRIAKADALEDTFTKHLTIAVIDLDVDEKPHIIFETLNARGEPLTQSDLIKNTVMYEAKVVDDAQKARELWGMFDTDEWWRRDSRDDKLKRIQIDKFLYYWIVMRTLRDVSPNRVALEFRKYLEERIHEESTIETITEEIKRAGKIYQDMEEGSFQEIQIFLNRMKAIELRVITPLLLWLYTSKVPLEQRKRSIEVLESYVVRRMLCGSTLNLNKVFINLSLTF